MSGTPVSPSGPGAVDEPAAVLDALGAILRRQLSLAQAGDFDGMDELAAEADATVKLASQLSPRELLRSVKQVELVRKLWKRLRLSLAGQKDELARARERLHSGKHIAKTYGWPGAAAGAGRRSNIHDTIL